jgi:hypothetical protein
MGAVMRVLAGQASDGDPSTTLDAALDKATSQLQDPASHHGPAASIKVDEWSPAVEPAVKRVLANMGLAGKVSVDTMPLSRCLADIGAEWQGRTCYGKPGVVYCSNQSLTRLIGATGWLSAMATSLEIASRRDGRARPAASIHAFTFEEAGEQDTVDIWTETLRTMAFASQLSAEDVAGVVDMGTRIATSDAGQAHRAGQAADAAIWVYRGAADRVLAFILGHELTHAIGACAFGSQSWAEASGTLNRFAEAQSHGRQICPANLVADELVADRCALRAVQLVDGRDQGDDVVHRDLASVSRRLAIDTVEGTVNLGFGTTASENSSTTPVGGGLGMMTVLRPMSRPGYLFPAFRVMLFARVLHELDPGHRFWVALCDGAAQRTMNSLAFDASVTCRRPSTPDLPLVSASDDKLVPDRTREAMRTNQWRSPPSTNYTCTP